MSVAGAMGSLTFTHFAPSHCWTKVALWLLWSAQVSLNGAAKPSRPSALKRAASRSRFSRPRRTSSPVTTFLPVIFCASRDGLGDQHRIVDAAVVENLTEFAGRGLALAGVDDELLDVAQRWKVGPGRVPVELLEALGAVARRRRRRRRRPPDRDELVHREARLDRLLDRGGVHRAPAVHDQEIGLVAADVEPIGRLVLHVGRRDRIELQRRSRSPWRAAGTAAAAPCRKPASK